MNQTMFCRQLDKESVPITTCGVMYSEATIILTPLLIISWIGIVIGNSLLWMFLKKLKTDSVQYIKAAILSVLPVATVGMPIEIIQTVTDYRASSQYVCTTAAKAVYACLFMSKLYVLYFITGLNIQRYCHITQSRFNFIMKKTSLVLPALALFVLLINIPILYEVVNTNRAAGKCLMARGCHYECELYCPPVIYFITGVVSFSMTVCNILISNSVIFLWMFMKKRDQSASRVLGHKRITNKTRATAAIALSAIFISAWVPYAFGNGPLRAQLSERQFHNAEAFLRMLGCASFLTLPTVYYFMDKNYATYVATAFRRFRCKHGSVAPQTAPQLPTEVTGTNKTIDVRFFP